MKKRSIFLATPMYGGNCSGVFAKCVAELTMHCGVNGVQFQPFFLFNESLITRARNYCADSFLRSNFTHLMFIDSDIGFDARDVLGMLALMGDDTEYDIMCGPYPKKAISWEKVRQAVNKGVADENPNELENYVGDYVFNMVPGVNQMQLNRPTEILEGGTGFMMIKRSVFEKFNKKFPNLAYRPDHARSQDFDGTRMIHAYFDCVIDRGYTFDDVKSIINQLAEGKNSPELQARAKELLEIEAKSSMRYLSEDYMFNQYARLAGSKVWMCPWIKLQHFGTFCFSGSLQHLASVGASATVDPGALPKRRKL